MQPRSILPGVPIIESPFFNEIAASNYFSEFESVIACDLNQYGFAVLPNFFSNITQQSKQIKTDLTPFFENCKQNGDKNSKGIQASRIQDGFRFSDTVKSLACDPRIISLLTKLYGRQAFAFQTLNFEYGSQQAAHSDAVHFHSAPERFMCGVWIALEDVTLDAGPLLYYPGSHKLPIYNSRQVGFIPKDDTQQTVYEPMWNKLIESNGLRKKVFIAKAGDALIWTANLLHGGEPIIRPDATRWSQVTHYFFDGCDYYTPMQSDLFDGKILKRDPIDIASGLKLSDYNKAISQSQAYQGKSSASPSAAPSITRTLFKSLTKLLGIKPKQQAPIWIEISLPTDFDEQAYLFLNPDLQHENFDPSLHYARHGYLEQRPYKINIPSNFDAVAYLELNPDVTASGLTAQAHFTLHGYRENRPINRSTHH
jgi:hypothetical protein